jgi:sugar (pentulose or hexulose) kinase
MRPVLQGGHDYLVGAIAVGAVEPGVILDLTGTWEMVLTPTTTPQWTEEIRQCGLALEAGRFPRPTICGEVVRLRTTWSGTRTSWGPKRGCGPSWEPVTLGLA